jgi:ribosome-associated protein
MRSLADRARESLAIHGAKITSSEGKESKSWILLDYGSILVHVFSPKARNYYGLEQLWGDAKQIEWGSNSSCAQST